MLRFHSWLEGMRNSTPPQDSTSEENDLHYKPSESGYTITLITNDVDPNKQFQAHKANASHELGSFPQENRVHSKEHVQKMLLIMRHLETKSFTNNAVPTAPKLFIHSLFHHSCSILGGATVSILASPK